MPANSTSLRITDLYRARILALVQRVERQTRSRWPAIEDFDRGSESWLAATAATVTGAQREAVRATQGYLAAYLSSELGRRTQPPPLDSSPYTGIARDGRPLAESLQTAPIGVRAALAEGKSAEEALRFGLDRGLRAVELDTKQAARQSLQDAMEADDRIVGWRRAVKGTCEACAGLADGAVSPPGTPLEIHPGCLCVSEAVVRNAPDRFPRPTGPELFAALSKPEQDAQFGEEKAALIRDGAVALHELVDRSPQKLGDDFVTAKPLEAVKPAT